MKSKLNFIIDAIMFVLMGALAGIGLLIKYILLPGSERWIKYGRNVDLSFFGLDRHQWGHIHLIVAYVLVGFLALHIILHWKMILCLYRKIIANKVFRWVCGLVFALITLIFVFAPFFINVDVDEMETGHERYQAIENSKTFNDTIKSNLVVEGKKESHDDYQHNYHRLHHQVDSSIEIKGYMTLLEINEKYEVPCEFLKEKLSIPENEPNSSKLGQLRKTYGFKMSEIELIIYNYKNLGNHEKDD